MCRVVALYLLLSCSKPTSVHRSHPFVSDPPIGSHMRSHQEFEIFAMISVLSFPHFVEEKKYKIEIFKGLIDSSWPREGKKTTSIDFISMN